MKQVGFYVSVIDGARWGLALGPFETKAEADAKVDPVRRYCADQDGRAWFYEYGTCKVTTEELPTGRLNGKV